MKRYDFYIGLIILLLFIGWLFFMNNRIDHLKIEEVQQQVDSLKVEIRILENKKPFVININTKK